MGKNESVRVLDHLMQKLPQLQQQEGTCCNAGGKNNIFKLHFRHHSFDSDQHKRRYLYAKDLTASGFHTSPSTQPFCKVSGLMQ